MSSGDHDYDRRKTADGPANRLKNVAQFIQHGDREIEVAKKTLHGLVAEMELTAKHTTDHKIKSNFTTVQGLAHRLDAIDADIDKLLKDIDRAAHQV